MKDYFKHMKYKYGEHTCMRLKYYSKQLAKLAKQVERLKFLLECKRYDLTPNHLKNSVKSITLTTTSQKLKQRLQKTKLEFLRKILKMEITQTNLDIKTTKDCIHYTEKELKYKLSETEFNTFKSKQHFISQNIGKETEETHASKIHTLKEQQLRNLGIRTNNDWFVNNTKISFPEEVKWLLSLGKKFTLPTTKTNFSPIHIIAEMEQAIQALNDDKAKEMARNKLSNRILQFKRNIKNNAMEKFITTAYNKSKSFLNLHKNKIIITEADKGNKTVVMYKIEYMEKMDTLLDDKKTYKKVRADPTDSLQKKNNKIVDDLYKQKYINASEKFKLFCSAAIAPRLYGLPKIHKPDMPLRPISSSVNVPCYQFSKYIGEKIQNVTSEEYNIKNVFRLKERLQDIHVDEDEVHKHNHEQMGPN
ncbi:lamin-like protein [Eurosta solidaginis]|uniref:lamin-like protein n=1 Tax=Eurosta solidaginis TaxID=178769 RepID=UPI00353170D9